MLGGLVGRYQPLWKIVQWFLQKLKIEIPTIQQSDFRVNNPRT